MTFLALTAALLLYGAICAVIGGLTTVLLVLRVGRERKPDAFPRNTLTECHEMMQEYTPPERGPRC